MNLGGSGGVCGATRAALGSLRGYRAVTTDLWGYKGDYHGSRWSLGVMRELWCDSGLLYPGKHPMGWAYGATIMKLNCLVLSEGTPLTLVWVYKYQIGAASVRNLQVYSGKNCYEISLKLKFLAWRRSLCEHFKPAR